MNIILRVILAIFPPINIGYYNHELKIKCTGEECYTKYILTNEGVTFRNSKFNLNSCNLIINNDFFNCVALFPKHITASWILNFNDNYSKSESESESEIGSDKYFEQFFEAAGGYKIK